MLKLVSVLALALSACSSTRVSATSVDTAEEFGLPPARGALVFPRGAREITLGWLVDELARLTGQELTMAPRLREELDQMKEAIELATPVPASEAYSYVEALLVSRSVILAPLKGGERPVLGVFGGASFDRNSFASAMPIALASDRFEILREHPAFYFQLTMDFQNIDSRQLQTQLRQLLVDNTGIQQAVPAGDRSLLLQGTGAKLASLVVTLREVDRAAAARSQPALPTPTTKDPR